LLGWTAFGVSCHGEVLIWDPFHFECWIIAMFFELQSKKVWKMFVCHSCVFTDNMTMMTVTVTHIRQVIYWLSHLNVHSFIPLFIYSTIQSVTWFTFIESLHFKLYYAGYLATAMACMYYYFNDSLATVTWQATSRCLILTKVSIPHQSIIVNAEVWTMSLLKNVPQLI